MTVVRALSNLTPERWFRPAWFADETRRINDSSTSVGIQPPELAVNALDGTVNSAVFVDPCRDVPIACRDRDNPSFAACPDAPSGAPGCPVGFQTGVTQTACATRDTTRPDDPAIRTRRKLITSCSLGRPETPGSTPARLCFLSCVDPAVTGDLSPVDAGLADAGPPTGVPNAVCEEGTFDPPEIPQDSYRWNLAGTGSTITLRKGSETVVVPIDGSSAFSAPNCGPGEVCRGQLSWVVARATAPFTLSGVTASESVLINPVPIRWATVTPINATESRIVFPDGARLFASTRLGSGGRNGNMVTAPTALLGLIKWPTREITISGTFYDTTNDVYVDLNIRGQFPNISPDAAAGVDRTVECVGPRGAMVSLSALGSTDPDDIQGTPNITNYRWSAQQSGNNPALPAFTDASGRDVTVLSPLGTRRFTVTAIDRSGSSNSDSMSVLVRDSVVPAFNSAVLPLCIPRDGQLRLFRPAALLAAFTDVCDSALRLEVVSIDSNRTDTGVRTPDTIRGLTNFCVRGEVEPPALLSRTYTVTVRVYDDANNFRTATVPVVVPSGTCSGSTWTVPTAISNAECMQ